jgi:3',5'-cyclic AMP phosphodiesterase CpdA
VSDQPFPDIQAPQHFLLHISDTHFVADRKPLHDAVDSDAQLQSLLTRIEDSGQRPEALIFSGDLADHGDFGAYQRLRQMVEPVAARLGTRVIWAAGNHDERKAFRSGLLGGPPSSAPIDSVSDVNGLRIVVLDSSVPGAHHGEVDDAQLAWLESELSTPAPDGTLLVIHHPPVPSPLSALDSVALRGQARLAEALTGTDVRGILSGHLHYSTSSSFAGIPVSVAPAVVYSQDLFVGAGAIRGVDGGRAVNLVHVYGDRVVHSSVPFEQYPHLYSMTADEISGHAVAVN